MAAQLILGGLYEETFFAELDVDCDADLILGYDWLRAHDLRVAFLCDRDQACLCAESGCLSASVSTSCSTSQQCQHRALQPPTSARSSG